MAFDGAMQHNGPMILISTYERLIDWIIAHAGGADKFAHVSAGLAIWLAAAIFLRRPLYSIRPLIVVAVAEAVNECIDRVAHGSWRWPDTRGDIAATMFWPTVLALALAYVPYLRGQTSVRKEGVDQPAAMENAGPV